MALPVDVSSVDVLIAVREGIVLFADDSRHALGSMESEVRRCIDWLTHDQRIYWESEVKRRKEKVNEAKAELHRKQLSQMFGGQSQDSQQREQVRDATRRLEEAEDKVESVQRWLPVVERAVMEYNGQARSFADMLEFDVERSIELLDRMITAIEEYTAITAPVTHQPIPTGASTANPVQTVASTSASPLITKGESTEILIATEPESESKPEPVEDKEKS